MKVISCRICSHPFQAFGSVTICSDCAIQVDRDFIRVREYIYDHPKANSIEEIAKETEVSERVILYLLRENRLMLAEDSLAPGSSAGLLICEICKNPIAGGRICSRCKNALAKDFDSAFPRRSGDSKSAAPGAKGAGHGRMHLHGGTSPSRNKPKR